MLILKDRVKVREAAFPSCEEQWSTESCRKYSSGGLRAVGAANSKQLYFIYYINKTKSIITACLMKDEQTSNGF